METVSKEPATGDLELRGLGGGRRGRGCGGGTNGSYVFTTVEALRRQHGQRRHWFGDLDAREVSLLMATCGMLLGPETLRAAFEEMDTDGDGTISSAELEVWWAAEVAPNLEINERTAQLQQVAPPAARKAGVTVESVDDLMDKLRNEAAVL